jgi:hypothetical protein
MLASLTPGHCNQENGLKPVKKVIQPLEFFKEIRFDTFLCHNFSLFVTVISRWQDSLQLKFK